MQRVNQFYFYQLGYILHKLAGVKEDAKLKDIYFDLLNCEQWLEFLLKDNLVPLGICRRACQDLRLAAGKPLMNNTKEGETTPDLDKEVTFSEAYGITNALRTFETVFSAELQSLDT